MKSQNFFTNTLDRIAFFGGTTLNSLAANYSHTQLWNPAESGKLLICPGFTVVPTAATDIRIGYHNVALTVNANTNFNKFLGGAAPSGQVRGQHGGAILGTISDGDIPCPGFLKFQDAFVIPEGIGLMVLTNGTGAFLHTVFFWREIPVTV